MLNITLDELEVYLFVKTRHDRSSWPHYKGYFVKIKDYFKERDFNPVQIGRYLITLEHLSSSSQAQYLGVLKVICKIMGVDYCREFKTPKRVSRKKFVLSGDEMKKVLDYSYKINYRYSVAMEVAIRAGLRFSEIRNLKWADFIGNELTLTDTKSGSPQTAFITQDLIDKIQKLKKRGAVMIFGNFNGNISNSEINRYLKKILVGCGIRKPMTFHDLRHTAATDLMNHDVNLYVIKQIMRHKDIKTTEHYLHMAPIKMLEAAKKHTLAVKNWTKEDLIKEVTKFQNTILDTNFKPSIKYGKNRIHIDIMF